MDKLQQSAVHGPCDATPTVTFPAVWHYCALSLISNKLYCLVSEAHVCEQLAYGRYLKVERPGVEPTTFQSQAHCHNHYTTRPHVGEVYYRNSIMLNIT